eukprot:jgi/Chlat1/6089/Chrsp40S05682
MAVAGGARLFVPVAQTCPRSHVTVLRAAAGTRSKRWSGSDCSSSSGGRRQASQTAAAAALSSSSSSSSTTSLHRSSSMPHVIETAGVPVYLYTNPDEVEVAALAQLRMIAEAGIAEGYVSAMPDVHLGKGATVGTVFASRSFVAPNAVGVDIGCGMAAVPVERLFRDDLMKADGTPSKELLKMQKLIKERVPTGFNEHEHSPPDAQQALRRITREHEPSPWLKNEIESQPKVAKQIGTLGGGNHFLEVVYDETGQVWLMLHSGSRNIGNRTAIRYDGIAATQMKMDGRLGRDKKTELNTLRIDSSEGQAYLQDMAWCQAYAFENRKAMLRVLQSVTREVSGARTDDNRLINAHHNFCQCETCTYTDPATGKVKTEDLWVTRKGATSARPGQPGLIPGSMGTGSFVVAGKGEPKAWSSCSHGAGRRLSRTAAFSQVTQSEFERAMQGVLFDRDERLRDEAPQAYKDLAVVMENQADLVEIKHRLRPLLNIKGIDKNPRQMKQKSV